MTIITQASKRGSSAGKERAWSGVGLLRMAAASILAVGLLAAGDPRPSLAQVPGVKEVKDLADAANQVSKQIDQLDLAKKAAALQTVADGLGKLAALGPALGLVGAGLDLFAVVSGAPSDTDRILAAIKDLSEQINHLDSRMVALFANLKDHTTGLSVRTVLTLKFSSIESAYRTWEIAHQRMNPDIFITTTMKNLAELYAEASLISDYCTGANKAVRLFDHVEKESFGDIETITSWAVLAVGRIAQAQLLDAFIFRVNEQAKSMAKTSAQIQESAQKQAQQKYESLLKGCHDAFLKAKASALTNREEHVRKYVTDAPAALGSSAATAKEIGEALKRKHPDKEWLVAIYKPVGGFDNHFAQGRQTVPMFRQQIGKPPEEKNVVVHWYNRGDGATPDVMVQRIDALKNSALRYVLFCERDTCQKSCGDRFCRKEKERGYRGSVREGRLRYYRYNIPDEIEGRDRNPPAFRLFGRTSETGLPDFYASDRNFQASWLLLRETGLPYLAKLADFYASGGSFTHWHWSVGDLWSILAFE